MGGNAKRVGTSTAVEEERRDARDSRITQEVTKERPQTKAEGTSVEPAKAQAPTAKAVPLPTKRASVIEASEPEKVFLDVETTGNDTAIDRIVQIAIVDQKGKVILEEYVMPSRAISKKAFDVHGITLADLKRKRAPPIEKLVRRIVAAIKGKLVVTYTTFDGEILPPECQRAAAFCNCFACFSKVNPNVRGHGKRALEAAAAFYCHPQRQADKHVASEASEICRRICMSLKERRRDPCPERYDPAEERASRAEKRSRLGGPKGLRGICRSLA